MALTLFDVASQSLEQHTRFNELEARGTLRIAIKAGGLDPRSVTLGELRIVFDKLLPSELEQRGIRNAVEICHSVVRDLENSPTNRDVSASSNPDDVFRRLAEG